MDDATEYKKDSHMDVTSQEAEDSNLKQAEPTPSHHESNSPIRQDQATGTKYKKLKQRFDGLKKVST